MGAPMEVCRQSWGLDSAAAGTFCLGLALEVNNIPSFLSKCCMLLFLAALLGLLCLLLLWDQQGWSWHSNLYNTSVLSFKLQGVYSTTLLL